MVTATAIERTDADADAATLVTTVEAARLAAVSVRAIRRWIRHRHLQASGRTAQAALARVLAAVLEGEG